MPIDITIIALSAIGAIFIGFIVLQYRLHAAKQTQVKAQTIALEKGKGKPILDFVDIALGEVEKTGTEIRAVLATKYNMTNEQQLEIIAPLKKRYDWLKWVKENEGISIPLIEGGQKLIQNLIKGFI